MYKDVVCTVRLMLCIATGKPFHVRAFDEVNPQNVHCYGPGPEPAGVRKGNSAIFTIDTTEAGLAPQEITTTDTHGKLQLLVPFLLKLT